MPLLSRTALTSRKHNTSGQAGSLLDCPGRFAPTVLSASIARVSSNTSPAFCARCRRCNGSPSLAAKLPSRPPTTARRIPTPIPPTSSTWDITVSISSFATLENLTYRPRGFRILEWWLTSGGNLLPASLARLCVAISVELYEKHLAWMLSAPKVICNLLAVKLGAVVCDLALHEG